MTVTAKILSLGCAALAVALTPSQGAGAVGSPIADLKAFAVHINRTPQQPWPGYGVYLGNGLILTAAHVAGDVAQTKPHVVIAGQDLPAALVKQGSLESVDLTLLSIDGTKLPVGLQMRRTPLCEHPPLCRRKGRRRHSRRDRPLQGLAAPGDSGRPARAVRHRHRRRRHHREFRLGRVRRRRSLPAWGS